ncbi:hypothetical protein HYS31_06375 [Candidatus Woesearchaeota archaeon]|nr:hypothetical protein [Candidatus Woesearchaeota archaeon]
MAQVTLEQINRNLIDLKKDVAELKEYMREDYELTDDVQKEIEEAKNTSRSEFIKLEELKRKLA